MSRFWSFLVALGVFLVDLGRNMGKRELLRQQKADDDALQEKYDAIDSQPRDLDTAIGRLRDRAQSAPKQPPTP